MPNFDGFVGGAYEAPSIYQDAQECINWYCEIDSTKKEGERGVIALYPTPGKILQFTFPDLLEVRGFYVLEGGLQMLAVCGPSLYLVNASLVATFIGSLLSFSGPVSISDNRIEALIVDGANRYSYSIAAQTLSVIASSDGAFVGGNVVDFADGFFVYNQPNSNIWAASSPLGSDTPALSFGSKGSSPDNIVTIIADHREVLLIGEKTTEAWINVGAFPFPFQIIPGTSFQHGCAAQWSLARLGESTAWLAQDTRGQAVVVQMAGYQPKRISTHAVEVDIMNGVISDAIAYTYNQEGHEFYVLTFPTQDKTWCYDLATQLWHKRAERDNLNVLHRDSGNCHAIFQGMHLVGDFQNGNVYSLDLNTYTDNGAPILRMRRAPHMTVNLNRVFYDSLQIQFQPGVGIPS